MSQTKKWLDGYIRAWRSKSAQDVRAIFTDDAEYWFRPDDAEPVRGIDAIVKMWGEPEAPDPQYDFEVLIEDERLGIITGHVDYPNHNSYTNLWEVHFAPDGRAQKFVEWFMTPRKAADGQDGGDPES
jgi:hypothetical protein